MKLRRVLFLCLGVIITTAKARLDGIIIGYDVTLIHILRASRINARAYLPERWLALAWEMGKICSESMPILGLKTFSLQNPASTTKIMPSTTNKSEIMSWYWASKEVTKVQYCQNHESPYQSSLKGITRGQAVLSLCCCFMKCFFLWWRPG